MKRLPLQILKIELDFGGDRQLIAAIHLCPAGQSRHENMNAPFSPERDKIILIEQGWERTNKTQVNLKNAPQLRQLVETCSTKETTNPRQVSRWIGQ